ncbi:MAG: GIY-YIG nuclease family protein, partial [Candidatus Bipolaricaulota bacterium]|nr:GIY-YIG nuclease family protein [Candidatus Bipolaricaulota bacterium]
CLTCYNKRAMHEKLALLPAAPGVYLFKDAHGKILYIGKASLLRERLRSYFQTAADSKTQRLMQEARDFDYIVTPDEREALLLEETLIKKHKPKFNIRLKDDKQYPYIKLTDDLFPRVELVRRAVGPRDDQAPSEALSLAHLYAEDRAPTGAAAPLLGSLHRAVRRPLRRRDLS